MSVDDKAQMRLEDVIQEVSLFSIADEISANGSVVPNHNLTCSEPMLFDANTEAMKRLPLTEWQNHPLSPSTITKETISEPPTSIPVYQNGPNDSYTNKYSSHDVVQFTGYVDGLDYNILNPQAGFEDQTTTCLENVLQKMSLFSETKENSDNFSIVPNLNKDNIDSLFTETQQLMKQLPTIRDMEIQQSLDTSTHITTQAESFSNTVLIPISQIGFSDLVCTKNVGQSTGNAGNLDYNISTPIILDENQRATCLEDGSQRISDRTLGNGSIVPNLNMGYSDRLFSHTQSMENLPKIPGNPSHPWDTLPETDTNLDSPSTPALMPVYQYGMTNSHFTKDTVHSGNIKQLQCNILTPKTPVNVVPSNVSQVGEIKLPNDVTHVMADFCQRPGVVPQMIQTLHRDIQSNVTLINVLKNFKDIESNNIDRLEYSANACKWSQSAANKANVHTVSNTNTGEEYSANLEGGSQSAQLQFHNIDNTSLDIADRERSEKKDSTEVQLSQSAGIHYLRATDLLVTKGGRKVYRCADCNFHTRVLKNLNGHLISRHNKGIRGLKTYSCSYCDYICVDKQRIMEHELTHTGVKEFNCAHCAKEFLTQRGLKTHLKYHSTDKPHKCLQCSASFKIKGKLMEHKKIVHTNKGKKPYKCGYCPHRASVRGNVNQHIKSLHKGKAIRVFVTETHVTEK